MSRAGSGSGRTRGQIGKNQYGPPVTGMPIVPCGHCGIDLRKGPQPKKAKAIHCTDCGMPCWWLNHTTLGYVRGFVPLPEIQECECEQCET